MLRQVRSAVSRYLGRREYEAIARWSRKHSQPLSAFAATINPVLWGETRDYVARLSADPALRERLAAHGIGTRRAHSAEFGFLYFLTRLLRPLTAVETGVSLGWSSRAILDALELNGQGMLYSSEISEGVHGPDFDPATVGICVEDRTRWRLFVDGDRVNLPHIVREAGRVDLFHYDSDKRYVGRQYALKTIEPYLHEGSVIVMDDIRDNWHFRDWAKNRTDWHVLTKDEAATERGREAWIGLAGLAHQPSLPERYANSSRMT